MAELGKVGEAFVEVRADMRRLKTELDGARGDVRKSAQSAGRQAAQAFNTQLIVGLKRTAGILAGALGVRAVQQYADAWSQAGNKIRAANQVSGIAAESLDDIAESARNARTNFEQYTNLYSRFLRVGGRVNATQEQIVRLTDITAKSFVAGGSAASEQAASILQLSQAIASGFLQGDELRSIRESAPLLAQAIADEFEVTIGELKELGAAGELTADRIFQAILRAEKEIEAQFAVTTGTIGQSLEKVRTSMIQFVGSTDNALGASDALRGSLEALADNFDEVAATAATFGAVLLAPRVAALGSTVQSLAAAAAAEAKYQAAVIRGQAVELDSAKATALKAQAQARSAKVAEAGAVLSRQSAAARVADAEAALVQNAALMKQAQAQQIQAKNNYELQRGLRASGQATQALSVAQRDYNRSTRTLLVHQRQQRALEAELVAAKKAHAVATGNVTAASAASTAAVQRQTAAMSALSVATRVATVATRVFGSILAFLGGPIGVLFIGATALATGLIDLGFGSKSAAEAMADLSVQVGRAQDALTKLQGINRALENDTERLERANKVLADAIEAGGDAAISAAAKEAGAIADRIKNNEALKQKYEELLRAQVALAKADLAIAERSFRREFAGSAASFQRPVNTGASGGEFGTMVPRGENLVQLQSEAIDQLREKAFAAAEAMEATNEQRAFIQADVDMRTAAQTVSSLEAALKDLNSVGEEPDDSNLSLDRTGLGDGAGGGGGADADAFETATAKIAEQAEVLKSVIGLYSQLNPLVDNYSIAAEAAAIEADLFNAAMKSGVEDTPQLRENIAAVAAEFSNLREQARRASDFGGAVDSIREDIKELRAETASLAGLDPTVRDFGRSLATATAEFDLLFAAERAGIEITDQLRDAIRQLAAEYGGAASEANRLKDAQDRVAGAAEDLRSTSSDALKDFLNDVRHGRLSLEGFVEVLERIVDKLAEVAFNAAFQQGTGGNDIFGSIANWITGGVGAFMGGSGGGGVTTMANNIFQGASSSIFTAGGGIALPGFAGGGRPPLNELAIVGEEGPELVKFGSPAQIFSNDDLTAMMSGSDMAARQVPSITFNQHNSFKDARGAKEASGSVARKSAEMVRRGGGYS